MLIQSQAGNIPSSRQSAGTPNVPGGTFGELLMSELNPVYYSLLKAGKVFSGGVANVVSLTQYQGTAASTPLLGLYNPVSSGVDFVLLQARYGVRSTGTTANSLGFNFYAANNGGIPVTGTQTLARNMYSLATGGSVSWLMANVVNTGAVATNLIAPSLSCGNVTSTATPNVGVFVDDIKGAIVVSPGGYLALGSFVTVGGTTFDCSLIWAELPV